MQYSRNISWNSTFDKLVCTSNRMFISFSNNLTILNLDSTFSYYCSLNYTLPSYTPDQIDFDVRNDIILVTQDGMFSRFNVSSFSWITPSISAISGLTSGAFISNSVVVLVNSTSIMQYDFVSRALISVCPISDTGYKHKISVVNNHLVMTKDLSLAPYNDTSTFYYNFSMDYSCVGCSSCKSGYTLNASASMCLSNSPISFIPEYVASALHCNS